jgi:DNA polymerase-3 subunit gamma/tau
MRAPAPSSAPRAQLAPAAVQEAATDAAPLVVGKFEDLIALAAEKRDLQMKISLERDVRLVRFEDGQLEIALEAGASKALVHDLARKLSIWTGRRWMVVVSAEAGAPTVKAQAETRQQELQTGVAADPLVQAVLNRFPGSQIVGVRARGAPEEPPPLSDVPPVDDGSAFDAEVPADDGDDDL